MNIQKLLVAAALALTALVSAHAGPISKGGFAIRKPGKYFLTKNLVVQPVAGLATTAGVVIAADDVELDLAGFPVLLSVND